MGIPGAYVLDNWNFCIIHLSFKYIAWTHAGKYLAIPFSNILKKSGIHTKISFSHPALISHVIILRATN
jgi:hypothetical protein